MQLSLISCSYSHSNPGLHYQGLNAIAINIVADKSIHFLPNCDQQRWNVIPLDIPLISSYGQKVPDTNVQTWQLVVMSVLVICVTRYECKHMLTHLKEICAGTKAYINENRHGQNNSSLYRNNHVNKLSLSEIEISKIKQKV